jgi:hypothetical protein
MTTMRSYLIRLQEFVDKGTQNFPEFRDEAMLKVIFAEAESKGLIYKSDYILYDLDNIELVPEGGSWGTIYYSQLPTPNSQLFPK